MRDRILVFDLLRILAISLVVLVHIGNPDFLNIPALYQDYGFLGYVGSLFWLRGNPGNWGVALFIIISGAVLEYTHQEIPDYWQFIKKRLVRLYPAYWLSLVLAVIFNPDVLSRTSWLDAMEAISGFSIFPTILSNVEVSIVIGQEINPMGWFIGLIVCLYFLFPILSKFLKKYGVAGLGLVFFISLITRTILIILAPSGMSFYWFPLSRLFEFALGIWIVQGGFYPRAVNRSRIIKVLSDLSFPVFLTHFFILFILVTVPGGIVVYFAVLAVLAGCVYFTDGAVQGLYREWEKTRAMA